MQVGTDYGWDGTTNFPDILGADGTRFINILNTKSNWEAAYTEVDGNGNDWDYIIYPDKKVDPVGWGLHADVAGYKKAIAERGGKVVVVPKYALTVTATNGTVSKSPDASTYDSASVVSLTAMPKSGYTFTGWSGAVSGTTNPVSVTMNAAKNVTATFTLAAIDSAHLYINQNTLAVKSASSQETSSEDGKSSNLLDGSTTTIWHSQYSGTAAKYPHEIVFDLAKTYAVSGIEYTGRSAGINGNVKGYEVYVSNDGLTWGTSVKTGTFTDVATAQKALFSSTEGRYVKFVAVSSQNGADFAAASEFNILWDAKYVVASTYALTVNDGTGDGTYTAGKSVAITATVPVGKEFVNWTSTPAGIISDVSKLSTTITMPGSAATVTAVFKDATAPTYALTVSGGTGSGSFKAGEVVTLTANVPSGKIFVKWTGNTNLLADSTKETTTITMPAEAVTITAVLKDATGVDTTGMSVNLTGLAGWDVGVDAYGSTATIDTSKCSETGIVTASFGMVAGDEAAEIYPWASISASFDSAFVQSTLFKVSYTSDKPVRLVLDQAVIAEDGIAYGYELPAGEKTLYISLGMFSQPDWIVDSQKVALDLSSVKGLSFEAVTLNAPTSFKLSELKANNYTIDPVGTVSLRNSSVAAIQLHGMNLTVTDRVQNGIVRVIGFNGRVLVEQVISSDNSVDLGSMNLSSGAYLLQIAGRNFMSPTMRFIVK